MEFAAKAGIASAAERLAPAINVCRRDMGKNVSLVIDGSANEK
ncbi:hypothetical protein [Breoghania sp. JC706]